MIENSYGLYYAVCDCCDKIIGPYDAFDIAVTQMKLLKWRFQRNNGDWTHMCPECRKQIIK